MKLKYLFIIPYQPLTLLIANMLIRLSGIHWQQTLYMGLVRKHPIDIALPQSVYILIVKIYLYLTLTIWRGQVYLIVSGNRTDSLIKPVDPAHETVMYIPTVVE